ncbi:UBX domain-containing protein 1 [Schistosoma japonicum]|nr:UBX domain-containing protein 1 [Schistosoma japonicum]
MHSARTGHVNYSESSDSVSPLTEDERKQQMEKLQELLRIKKVQREEQEKHEEFEREKKRRQQCKTLSSAKAKFEEDEIRRLIEQKKREKEEDRAYREKLKAEIAREQEEKRAREAGESLVITSNSAPVSNTAPKINPTICRLQIRLPSGQPIKGEFGVNEPLSAVTLYVSQNWPNSSTFIDPQSIHLMTNFPKQEFTDEDMSKSLLDLGLCPSAVLIVRQIA